MESPVNVPGAAAPAHIEKGVLPLNPLSPFGTRGKCVWGPGPSTKNECVPPLNPLEPIRNPLVNVPGAKAPAHITKDVPLLNPLDPTGDPW